MSTSRIVGALGLLVAIVGALNAGGALNLIPAKYAAIITVVGATAAALSERIQGGSSKQ